MEMRNQSVIYISGTLQALYVQFDQKVIARDVEREIKEELSFEVVFLLSRHSNT